MNYPPNMDWYKVNIPDEEQCSQCEYCVNECLCNKKAKNLIKKIADVSGLSERITPMKIDPPTAHLEENPNLVGLLDKLVYGDYSK